MGRSLQGSKKNLQVCEQRTNSTEESRRKSFEKGKQMTSAMSIENQPVDYSQNARFRQIQNVKYRI